MQRQKSFLSNCHLVYHHIDLLWKPHEYVYQTVYGCQTEKEECIKRKTHLRTVPRREYIQIQISWNPIYVSFESGYSW